MELLSRLSDLMIEKSLSKIKVGDIEIERFDKPKQILNPVEIKKEKSDAELAADILSKIQDQVNLIESGGIL